MANALGFDDAVGSQLEAVYKTEDAVRRRRAVLKALRLSPGERVLDIGTGPGFLAREMADAVGAIGQIVGIDASEPMLALARKRCADKPWTRFDAGDAGRLSARDSEFDVAVSVQVYEYIPDVDAALAEMHRVLRPGGRALIVSTDWRAIAFKGTDEDRMQRVLTAFAEHCAHQDLPRSLAPRLRSVGFSVTHQEVIPIYNPSYDPSTYSYNAIPLLRNFVVGRHGLTEADVAEWCDDLRRLGDRGEYFFCLNQYLFTAARSAAS